jgi:hypothetical protein
MTRPRRADMTLSAVISGIAIAVSSVLPWISSGSARPQGKVEHVSASKMLSWKYVAPVPFDRSVGLAILVCGALVVLGALAGSRLVTAVFAVVTLAVAGSWIGLYASAYRGVVLLWPDLQVGGWLALVGGLIALISGLRVRRAAPADR